MSPQLLVSLALGERWLVSSCQGKSQFLRTDLTSWWELEKEHQGTQPLGAQAWDPRSKTSNSILLAIKCMTSSSLRVENQSKWLQHTEAGSECGLEPVATASISVRIRLIFCTRKFLMSFANTVLSQYFWWVKSVSSSKSILVDMNSLCWSLLFSCMKSVC